MLFYFFVVIITFSIISFGLLVFQIYNPKLSIIFSVLISGLIITFTKDRSSFHLNINLKFILLVLILGLIIRTPPYDFLSGGQDQGTYHNYAKYISDHGSSFVQLKEFQNIPEEVNKILSKKYIWWNKHNLPGLYINRPDHKNSLTDRIFRSESKFDGIFQFYPMHPIWMSLFSEVFGDENSGYSLIFFSLLSIFIFYLLLSILISNQLVISLTTFLYAIIPLNIFFSKWPVTEIQYSFFILSSFFSTLLYLKYFQTKYIIIAVLLFLIAGFIRIDLFLFGPIIIFAYLLNNYHGSKIQKSINRALNYFGLCILISLLYGYIYTYPYFYDIIIGKKVHYFLIFISSVYASLLIQKKFFNNFFNHFNKFIISKTHTILSLILIISIIIGSYHLYQIGFTDHYENSFKNNWGASNSGIKIINNWSITKLFKYLSPFVLILCFYKFFKDYSLKLSNKNIFITFIFVFFLSYFACVHWFVGYEYYYSRYIVPVLIPITLIYVATFRRV